MKSAVFDIETTALEGVGAGLLICACVRPTNTGRTKTFRLEYRKQWNPSEEGFLETEERQLITELVDCLSEYDLLIGHNIENFDLGYIRTRAEIRQIPFYLAPFTYDTMKAIGRVKLRTVLNYYGKPSKSMDMMADLLGLDQLKTKIYPRQHWLTVWGNDAEREESMGYIVDHCKRDVRMNHEMYNILLPMDKKASIRRWM